MKPMDIYHENLAATLIENFKKRQIDASYCATAKEAVALASTLIPAKSTVAFGGSMTLSESGMMAELTARTDITLYNRDTASTPEEVAAVYHQAFHSDYFFMSSNAISATGELVNIDGNGNRVAPLIYGPKQVFILAGMNKVEPTLKAALVRARNIAAPINCNRLNRQTPCGVTGICSDCLSPDCICAQTVITRRSQVPNRIKVILIGESLGY